MVLLPEVPVDEPSFMFEVKLFQVLQRDSLLLLPTPMEQTLHTTLRHTDTNTGT